MATIEIIIGSMFSGKSTELLRRCRTYCSIRKKILLINHSLDSRCKNELKTHDNTTMDAIKSDSLLSVTVDSNVDVIAIDEAQFFHDLYDFITVHENKKIVILIAGLDGDSNRETFGEILKCIPLCNKVTKLSALCSICCNGTEASFSKRLTSNSNKVCIGAISEYLAVCRKHYFNPSIDDSSQDM
jgi:thymidine kinase